MPSPVVTNGELFWNDGCHSPSIDLPYDELSPVSSVGQRLITNEVVPFNQMVVAAGDPMRYQNLVQSSYPTTAVQQTDSVSRVGFEDMRYPLSTNRRLDSNGNILYQKDIHLPLPVQQQYSSINNSHSVLPVNSEYVFESHRSVVDSVPSQRSNISPYSESQYVPNGAVQSTIQNLHTIPQNIEPYQQERRNSEIDSLRYSDHLSTSAEVNYLRNDVDQHVEMSDHNRLNERPATYIGRRVSNTQSDRQLGGHHNWEQEHYNQTTHFGRRMSGRSDQESYLADQSKRQQQQEEEIGEAAADYLRRKGLLPRSDLLADGYYPKPVTIDDDIRYHSRDYFLKKGFIEPEVQQQHQTFRNDTTTTVPSRALNSTPLLGHSYVNKGKELLPNDIHNDSSHVQVTSVVSYTSESGEGSVVGYNSRQTSPVRIDRLLDEMKIHPRSSSLQRSRSNNTANDHKSVAVDKPKREPRRARRNSSVSFTTTISATSDLTSIFKECLDGGIYDQISMHSAIAAVALLSVASVRTRVRSKSKSKKKRDVFVGRTISFSSPVARTVVSPQRKDRSPARLTEAVTMSKPSLTAEEARFMVQTYVAAGKPITDLL